MRPRNPMTDTLIMLRNLQKDLSSEVSSGNLNWFLSKIMWGFYGLAIIVVAPFWILCITSVCEQMFRMMIKATVDKAKTLPLSGRLGAFLPVAIFFPFWLIFFMLYLPFMAVGFIVGLFARSTAGLIILGVICTLVIALWLFLFNPFDWNFLENIYQDLGVSKHQTTQSMNIPGTIYNTSPP